MPNSTFGSTRLRVVARGGMFYIERKRWLLGWCQEYEYGIDMARVPVAYFNEQAARQHVTYAQDRGRVLA